MVVEIGQPRYAAGVNQERAMRMPRASSNPCSTAQGAGRRRPPERQTEPAHLHRQAASHGVV